MVETLSLFPKDIINDLVRPNDLKDIWMWQDVSRRLLFCTFLRWGCTCKHSNDQVSEGHESEVYDIE